MMGMRKPQGDLIINFTQSIHGHYYYIINSFHKNYNMLLHYYYTYIMYSTCCIEATVAILYKLLLTV